MDEENKKNKIVTPTDEWSDRNPSNATILRIVALYKQWYTTESSGSIEEYVKQHWEDK